MTDGDWDFEVVRVDLDGLGINAGQEFGMVIVQPEYELSLMGQFRSGSQRVAGRRREAWWIRHFG